MQSGNRFTLVPRRWYALQFIGWNGPEAFSPIRVERVKSLHAGNRCFELAFYHANYPEGVRDKLYELETLERGKAFLLAHRRPRGDHDCVILIHDVSWLWLRQHFNVDQNGNDEGVQGWLESNT